MDKLECAKSVLMLVQFNLTNNEGSLPEEYLVNALELVIKTLEEIKKDSL